MITVVGPSALLDDLKGPEIVIIRSPAGPRLLVGHDARPARRPSLFVPR
jgi:hypothetical protein